MIGEAHKAIKASIEECRTDIVGIKAALRKIKVIFGVLARVLVEVRADIANHGMRLMTLDSPR